MVYYLIILGIFLAAFLGVSGSVKMRFAKSATFIIFLFVAGWLCGCGKGSDSMASMPASQSSQTTLSPQQKDFVRAAKMMFGIGPNEEVNWIHAQNTQGIGIEVNWNDIPDLTDGKLPLFGFWASPDGSEKKFGTYSIELSEGTWLSPMSEKPGEYFFALIDTVNKKMYLSNQVFITDEFVVLQSSVMLTSNGEGVSGIQVRCTSGTDTYSGETNAQGFAQFQFQVGKYGIETRVYRFEAWHNDMLVGVITEAELIGEVVNQFVLPIIFGQTFKDIRFERAVREALEIGDAPFTQEHFQLLKQLDASNRDIQFLDGIERFVGLEEVDLSGNHFRDASPLARCRSIYRLDISDVGSRIYLDSVMEVLNSLPLRSLDLRDISFSGGVGKFDLMDFFLKLQNLGLEEYNGSKL